MKHESINAMAHEWSREFMNAMKHADGGSVVEDLQAMAKSQPDAKVVIDWIPATHEALFKFPLRVRKYVMAHRLGFDEHLQRYAIDTAALLAFRTEVFAAENGKLYVRSYVLDDRNKEHITFVHC